MKTQRLYYDDPYLTSFTATVQGTAADGKIVYFDRTAFYPSSGGQPHDFGICEGRTIVDVVDEGDRIAHHFPEQPGLTDGKSASCEIDWPRRYDHMQQHTGQHLLSAILDEQFGFATLSFHMSDAVSAIELSTPEITSAQIDAVHVHAAEAIAQARPVHIIYEDAAAVSGLRKASQREGTLRIIEIEGLDRSACGGTHVRNTSEIGPLLIRRLDKVRGNTRIEFVCGLRALNRARQDYQLLSNLSRLLTIGPDDLPVAVANMRERLVEVEKDRRRLALDAARREGQTLYEQTLPASDGIRRLFLSVPELNEDRRATAQAFTEGTKAAAFLIAQQKSDILYAVSSDLGIHAGNTLKPLLLQHGGRGGGSASIAQGTVPDATLARTIATACGFDASSSR